MKILRTKYITENEADTLIEKYYDGLTSNKEEESLIQFLSQKKLSSKYEAEKDIFHFFEAKKEKKPVIQLKKMTMIASVAAVFALIIGISVQMQPTSKANYAYVDGKKILNIEKIDKLANESLNSISSNDNDIMEEQLNQFSDINF